MAHFDVCIFVSRDAAHPADEANKLLSKFDINLRVPLHKEYLGNEDIAAMKQWVAKKGKHITSNNGLVQYVAEWTGYSGECGYDKHGLYVVTDTNPEGHIDAWNLYGPVDDHTKLTAADHNVLYAVLTPDGIWHSGQVVYADNYAQKQAFDEWIKELNALIGQNKDNTAFVAECHG